MSQTEVRSPRGEDAPAAWMAASVAIAVGLAVGVVTAYAQGWLRGSSGSLANSAGPWSLAAFVVARYGRRIPVAVVASMLTLACCELGYVIGTQLRGGSSASSTVVFWLTAAVLAGPPLGVAGAWSSGDGVRRSLGFAVIAGVLIGEGAYGWTTISDTTDWRYWAGEVLIGAVILVVMMRRRSARELLAAVGATAATALVVFGVARLA